MDVVRKLALQLKHITRLLLRLRRVPHPRDLTGERQLHTTRVSALKDFHFLRVVETISVSTERSHDFRHKTFKSYDVEAHCYCVEDSMTASKSSTCLVSESLLNFVNADNSLHEHVFTESRRSEMAS